MGRAATNGRAKTAKKKAGKRGKQDALPGLGRKKDKKLASLADALYDVRIARIELQKEEGEAAFALIAEMTKKGVEVYEDHDLDIRCTLKPGKDKVSVKKLESDDGD